ncbi:MAG: hypothetical protein ACOY3F_00580 [Bacillota bacterium]
MAQGRIMRYGHPEAGMTIVEAIVAAALLGIAVFAIAQTQVFLHRGYEHGIEKSYRSSRAAAAMREIIDGSGDVPGLRAAAEVRIRSGGTGIAYLVTTRDGSSRVREYYVSGTDLLRATREPEQGWPQWSDGQVVVGGVSAFSASSEGSLWVVSITTVDGTTLTAGALPHNVRPRGP